MARSRIYAIVALCLIGAVGLVLSVGLPGIPGCRQQEVTPAPATQPAVRVPAAGSQDGIHVYFSPRGRATDAVVEQLEQATQTIEVMAYQFNSAPIAKALLDAHKRGVQVTVVLDPGQEENLGIQLEGQPRRYSSATFFHNQSIPVYIDRRHAIAHNKVMLIDGRTIITGSFNFTKAGEESNAENLLIVRDKPEIYSAYERNFREHLKHATRYEGRDTRDGSNRGRTSRPPARGR